MCVLMIEFLYVCLICENPGIDVVLPRAVAHLCRSEIDLGERRYGGPSSNTRAYLQSPFAVTRAINRGLLANMAAAPEVVPTPTLHAPAHTHHKCTRVPNSH